MTPGSRRVVWDTVGFAESGTGFIWRLGRLGCCGIALRRPGDLRSVGAVFSSGCLQAPAGWCGMLLDLRNQGRALFGDLGCCDIALRRPGDLRSCGRLSGAGASRLPQGGFECSHAFASWVPLFRSADICMRFIRARLFMTIFLDQSHDHLYQLDTFLNNDEQSASINQTACRRLGDATCLGYAFQRPRPRWRRHE